MSSQWERDQEELRRRSEENRAPDGGPTPEERDEADRLMRAHFTRLAALEAAGPYAATVADRLASGFLAGLNRKDEITLETLRERLYLAFLEALL